MPKILNPSLTVSVSGSTISLRMVYEAEFTETERPRSGNALDYKENIYVIGSDVGERMTTPGYDYDAHGGENLPEFGRIAGVGHMVGMFSQESIPVPAGTGAIKILRDRPLQLSRDRLVEDKTGNDEIVCKIEIIPPILKVEAYSNINLLPKR